METLSWMRKVDMGVDKIELLYIIDNMHEVINALTTERIENEEIIKELRDNLEKFQR